MWIKRWLREISEIQRKMNDFRGHKLMRRQLLSTISVTREWPRSLLSQQQADLQFQHLQILRYCNFNTSPITETANRICVRPFKLLKTNVYLYLKEQTGQIVRYRNYGKHCNTGLVNGILMRWPCTWVTWESVKTDENAKRYGMNPEIWTLDSFVYTFAVIKTY